MTEESIREYPERTLRDGARTGLDMAVAAIPVVGGPVSILIDAVIAPGLEKRRREWFNHLAMLVGTLETATPSVAISDLVGNEDFVDAVVQVSAAAMKTHRSEKLVLLQSALEGVAFGRAGESLRQRRLIQLVDELEPEHVVVLRYLSDPVAWFARTPGLEHGRTSGTAIGLLRQARLPVPDNEIRHVLKDLGDRLLANTQSMEVSMTDLGLFESRLLPLGVALVDLIGEVVGELPAPAREGQRE